MTWLNPSQADLDEFNLLDDDSINFQFALHLAPALRIDATVLRNMRVRYFPASNASLESGIWFSNLVESRSARIITFKPGLARLLTDRLALTQDYSEIILFLTTLTRDWPKELHLEQQLRLATRIDDTQFIEDSLRKILNWFTNAKDDHSRIELLRWVRAAIPGLIKPHWKITEVQWLIQLAAVTLGDATGELAQSSQISEGLPHWLQKRVPPQLPGKLGLNIRPGQLEFVKAGAGQHDLPVGTAIPALIGINQNGESKVKWERVWPGKVINTIAITDRLELITLSGQRFELLIEQESDSNTQQTRTGSHPVENINLFHLKEETRDARNLANRLRDMGIYINLETYQPDDPPRNTQDNIHNMRLWSSKSAKYFSESNTNEKSFTELVVRMDNSPLPAGQQNILNIDLFDNDNAISESGLEQLINALNNKSPKLSVWLSWGSNNEAEMQSVRNLLEQKGIHSHSHSTAIRPKHFFDEKLLDKAFIESDAVFVISGDSNTTYLDRRFKEIGTARNYQLPIFQIMASKKPKLKFADIEMDFNLTMDQLEKLTPLQLQQLLGDWSDQQAKNRPNGLIYISHVFEDHKQVETLTKLLTVDGWNVRLDQEHLHPGDEFKQQLKEIIYESAYIINCWSKASISSSHINEVNTIANKRKNYISIILEQLNIINGDFLEPAIDFTQWNGQSNSIEYRQLTAAINEKLSTADDIEEPIESRQSKTEAISEDSEIESATETKPEEVQMVEELSNQSLFPRERLEIGDALAEIGDPRRGVGLDADGLPDIDWVKIPAGEFLYGEKKQAMEIEPYYIARYPITNEQYDAFIKAGGYKDERWWQGLAERIKQPEKPQWSQPNRPRETVSWFEAIAFCRWLSERLGYSVSLPTEPQWERAARGTDGREYPWGDDYQSGYANVDEKETQAGSDYLQQTSSVGMYAFAGSQEGVQDLCGNVWEWCLDEDDNPEKTLTEGDGPRVLRGGSWLSGPHNARMSFRFRVNPDYRYNDLGFRVVCSSPIPR